MTLKIYDKTITVSEIEAKRHEAELSVQKLIDTPKVNHKLKFLSLIEIHLIKLIKNNISVQKIGDMIWNVYKIYIPIQFLYSHVNTLREKHDLQK